MSNLITVGISDLNIAQAPDVLVTYALGSCVGICLYDSATKTAGLSHIMLPSSSLNPNAGQEHRFADTAIVALVKKLEAAGANPRRLKAKIAGGAQMFPALNNSAIANIGKRNIDAVREMLGKLSIPIVADDTGKDYGRTLFFNAEDGSMRIKSASKGEWVW
ncbi:MAG: chemotaxis protein CheD [Clostridiales bacterium]|jgi:chemotaxis protein CheD|nr:chemotaxis protein CheD [Clostridiales bacterium]